MKIKDLKELLNKYDEDKEIFVPDTTYTTFVPMEIEVVNKNGSLYVVEEGYL